MYFNLFYVLVYNVAIEKKKYKLGDITGKYRLEPRAGGRGNTMTQEPKINSVCSNNWALYQPRH